jgi:hypothetical protein
MVACVPGRIGGQSQHFGNSRSAWTFSLIPNEGEGYAVADNQDSGHGLLFIAAH